MPVCRYIPEQNECVYDQDLYWGDLDNTSKLKCKQQHRQEPRCGQFIPEEHQILDNNNNIMFGGKRKRTRTLRRKLKRKTTRRRSSRR